MKRWLIVIVSVLLVCAIAAGPLYGSILNQQTESNTLGIDSASAASTGNTIQAFLVIDGIEGDSTSQQHSHSIELMDFNWTEALPLTWYNYNSKPSTATQWGAFTFTAHCSSASPDLFLACARQNYISTATLYVQRTSGGQTKDFLVWKLGNVVVGSYSTSIRSSDGSVVDVFSLYFGKAVVEYMRINADGSYGSPVEVHYDIQAGK